MRINISILLILLTLSCGNTEKESKSKEQIEKKLPNPIRMEEKEIITTDEAKDQTFCDSCTIDRFRHIRLEVDKTTKDDLYSFFICCNEYCSENVEFSEFSSYLVYFILEHKTDLMLQVLEDNRKDLPLDHIKGAIESPISDQINLKNIYSIVEKSSLQNKIKDEILESIKTAMSKY